MEVFDILFSCYMGAGSRGMTAREHRSGACERALGPRRWTPCLL